MALPEIVDAFLRVLATLAGCAAAGLVVFRTTLLSSAKAAASATMQPWIAVALLLDVLRLLAQPARYTGSFASSFEWEWLSLALDSAYGTGFAFRVAALTLLSISAFLSNPATRLLALAGFTMGAVGLSMTGHVTQDIFDGSELQVVFTAHVALFSLWWGSLLGLLSTYRHADMPTFARVLGAFSRIATFWFPVLLLSGAWLAWRLLGGWPETLQPYTLLLIAKLVLVGAAATLAGLNRWRWAPRLSARPESFRPLIRSIHAESFLVAAIVAITIAMTTWTAPH